MCMSVSIYSVSTSLGNTTVGVAPDGVTTPTADSSGEVDVFSLLLIDQNTFEGLSEVTFVYVHTAQLCVCLVIRRML